MHNNKVRVISHPQGKEPLLISLESHEYRLLSAVAARTGVAIGSLAADILQTWLTANV